MICVCALLSYDFADMIGLSGITSILFCGMFMTRYAEENLNEHSRVTLDYIMKMAAGTSEAFVFIYIGSISVTQFVYVALERPLDVWDVPFIVITTFVIVPTRFIVTFFIAWFANRRRVRPISLRNQVKTIFFVCVCVLFFLKNIRLFLDLVD